MAFLIQNFARVSTSTNEPIITLQSGAITGAPRFFTYVSLADSQAVIVGAGYFNSLYLTLSIGDIIYAYSTIDGTMVAYYVSNNVGGVVTITVFANIGPIGTANIQNLAVTAAKIANNTITSTQIATSIAQVATGQLSPANINGMYAGPVQLVAAAGANTLIIVDDFVIELVWNTAQYAAGGAFGLQYDNTAHLAGALASATLPAVILTTPVASSVAGESGSLPLAGTALTVNKGIWISNLTQAFTTGDSAVNWYIKYRVVTTT